MKETWRKSQSILWSGIYSELLMDVGSTEIIFNPENITFNLIITSSKCEAFPLSEGEKNQYIYSIHRKISRLFPKKKLSRFKMFIYSLYYRHNWILTVTCLYILLIYFSFLLHVQLQSKALQSHIRWIR